MLKREDNELITRVGPGTPMGETMRRYWLPALLAEELPEPDCPPVRVRLLGENLVAFRDTNGQVGLVAENCPHRGASLFFGRNEEEGLRCVYHGWKFNTDGTCVDMPNEPPESNFKHKVRVAAYPAQEKAGVIWTYMGPAEKQPPMPNFEWMRAPAGHRHISKSFQDCNYLQALEGGLDTSHTSFLHRRFNPTLLNSQLSGRIRHPRLEVLTTDYGYTYGSVREMKGEGKDYVRAYHFIMPFHQMRPFDLDTDNRQARGHCWVPIDDEHTYVYNWILAKDEPFDSGTVEDYESFSGRGKDDYVPGTYRLKANRENDYLLDREMQRTVNFTGIAGLNTQDLAVQETMGPIFDRTKEKLGAADTAIIVMRRLLIQAAKDVADGKDPLGSQGTGDGVRPAEMILPAGTPWYSAIKDELIARL